MISCGIGLALQQPMPEANTHEHQGNTLESIVVNECMHMILDLERTPFPMSCVAQAEMQRLADITGRRMNQCQEHTQLEQRLVSRC